MIALLTLVLAGRAHAAAGVTIAVYPETLTVAPGAVFDLELRVTQAGSGFNGFDAIVSHDPAALTFLPLSPTSLQQGSLMTGACGNTFHRFLAGADVDTINDVLLCSGVALTGPGQVYKLRFQAANTPQLTSVRFVPGAVRFYNAGVFVTPVVSTNALIGIGEPAVSVDGSPDAAAPAFMIGPNPARGSVGFASASRGAGPESLTICDVQGRVVRVLSLAGHHASWDGRWQDGAPAADGVYFATLHAAGRARTVHFAWVH